MKIDPALKQILANLITDVEANALYLKKHELGKLKQLETVVKIQRAVPPQFFNEKKELIAYPTLEQGKYLVVLEDRWDPDKDVHVVVIYNFGQIQAAYERWQKAWINTLEWAVLEIPREVEKKLLKD